MEKIIRGSGFTASERYLNQLSDRTFLKLWTYPNTFSDRNKHKDGDGKELCDLLIVCGDDMIIFSDKSIDWPAGNDIVVSWCRWYQRAIAKSVDQIRGAERWLRTHPNRVFLDAKCTRAFPVQLPPHERRRVHGIAIVRGAHEACSRYMSDDDGSLILAPRLKGIAHTNPSATDWIPFAIGDVNPNSLFVHVLDQTALDCVMTEMDTISDFVAYLDARANAIRREDLFLCPSEADLLAYYMTTENPLDRPHFLRKMNEAQGSAQVAILPGAYKEFISSRSCKIKKSADSTSYLWDNLINIFVEHVMDGSSVSVQDHEASASLAEPALRIMALESRLRRRILAEGFSGFLQEAQSRPELRYARAVLPGKLPGGDIALAYVFMSLEYTNEFEFNGGYPRYREVRHAMLVTYCHAILSDNRTLKRAVGVAIDKPGRRKGGSEDLIAVEVTKWTTELESAVERNRADYEILDPGRTVQSHMQRWEYPPAPSGNRHHRRAAKRRSTKAPQSR